MSTTDWQPALQSSGEEVPGVRWRLRQEASPPGWSLSVAVPPGYQVDFRLADHPGDVLRQGLVSGIVATFEHVFGRISPSQLAAIQARLRDEAAGEGAAELPSNVVPFRRPSLRAAPPSDHPEPPGAA